MNASTRLSINGKSPMISTDPPFVLRLSKDERMVFQQNHILYKLQGCAYTFKQSFDQSPRPYYPMSRTLGAARRFSLTPFDPGSELSAFHLVHGTRTFKRIATAVGPSS